MRYSSNEYRDGLLFNGYDYTRQAWVVDGRYVPCGHPNEDCGCFGKRNQGQPSMERE